MRTKRERQLRALAQLRITYQEAYIRSNGHKASQTLETIQMLERRLGLSITEKPVPLISIHTLKDELRNLA